MPTSNQQDARDLGEHVRRVFAASQDERQTAIRALFVEKLDFNPASGQVDLTAAPAGVKLPAAAERVAQLDGVYVLYVPLNIRETDRVRRTEASAAARLIAGQLGEDMLLVFTNTSRSQLHFIHPEFDGAQPTLRRMVVERDLPRRTAVEQFSEVYWSYERSGSIRDALAEAFDVEPVTKRFFQEYKRVFEAAKEQVSGFGRSEEEEKRLFIQTLFNRLMFVYFLSRKGWLVFGGDNDYLKALWNDYRAASLHTNFYISRLAPLFFAGLNNPQSRNLSRDNPALYDLIGDVPFLNGGLFEKSDLDQRTDIVVPDDAIEPVLRDLFDKFNFTVMESTPFDIEVAVDPEMLGKVFEELVTGRHESGSYYTPRPVVSFMCREALKGYLEGRNTGLSSDSVAAFVDGRDASEIPLASAGRVADALDQVTVVDPACGSGAYLLGMMHELVELQIELYNVGVDARGLYELKLHIIQRNLYGVDIDEFAVNIAMLRMWLSLAIEYEGETPGPLPNLDFKVVCGDSLLGPEPMPAGQSDFTWYEVRRLDLGAVKDGYMRAVRQPDKTNLKQQIEDIKQQIRDALGDAGVPQDVVDWRVEFAEVFATRGGFDVVIANPPYVRHEQIGPVKADLAKLFPSVYQGTADILVYFYARAIELMRPGGSLAFITSNKFMRAGYGKKLRAFLRNSLAFSQVMDFGDLPVFAATSYPAVLIGRKGQADDGHQLRVADLTIPVRKALKDQELSATPETVNRAMDGLPDLLDRHGHADYPQLLLRQSGWILEDPALIRLFERLMNQGTPLGEFVDGRIYRGIVTGLNKAFVIDRYKRNELVDADPPSAEIIKPWLRGRDIKRWSAKWAGNYIVAIQNSGDSDATNPWAEASTEADARRIFATTYPAIHDHMSGYENRLRPRSDQGRYWWELRACAYYPEFARPKIIWPEFARSVRFCFDANGRYVNNKCYVMPINSMWMLAVLNSDLVEFLLCQITSSLRGGFMQLYYHYTSRLPIVPPTSGLQRNLDSIAHTGIAGEPVDTNELNEIVHHLYNLSPADVALINDWFKRRSLVG